MLRLPSVILAAVGTALASVLLFGTAHALIIVPIWTRLPSGLPFALAAAGAIAWAHADLVRAGRLGLRIRHGLILGLSLWVLLLVPTAFGVVAHVTGLHTRSNALETAAEGLLAFTSGALAGWYAAGPRAGLSGGVAVLALTLAMGGPIPVTNGLRPRALWLAFIPLLLGACVLHLQLLKVFGAGRARHVQ